MTGTGPTGEPGAAGGAGATRVVDARPILAAGGEPFAEIMAAAASVAGGGALVVYAPFEPVPLEGLLGGQGFGYVADQLDGGDWRVTFSRP